jgi:hypothetical protein
MNPTDGGLNSQGLPLDVSGEPGLGALHEELARAFAFFNARCWSGQLPTPVFAFFAQPPRTQRLGHYQARSWQAADGSVHDEIVIYADLALSLGIHEILVTLLHEMVHVWQAHFDRPSLRHNAAWHQEASRVGLVTHGPKGFTSAGDGFLAAVAEFQPRVDEIPFRLREGPRTKGKLAKWVCACGYGVRVAVPHFDATCHHCGERFRLAQDRTPRGWTDLQPPTEVEVLEPEGDEG